MKKRPAPNQSGNPTTPSAPGKTPPPALILAARNAMRQAYAPYSRFKVGAALLDTQGNIHAGCNVENASYGLTLCAERVALASAVARGTRRFQALAIVASGASAPYPCGACRQVLAEFAKPGMPVYVASASSLRSAEVLRFGDLLPHSFRFRKRQGGPRHD